jgi:microcystin-dependent protein
MPVHTHIQNAHNHELSRSTNGVYNSGGSGIQFQGLAYTVDTVGNRTATNQNAGSGSEHLNTQPTIVLNYIIKAL